MTSFVAPFCMSTEFSKAESQQSYLPVEQPTKFEFVVNLTTAKTLGLDISPALLSLADDLVE